MDVVRQIELTYWELTLAREVLGIRRFGVGLAEQQVSREEDLKAVGKAVRGDVMTANAERAAREADLADALAVWESQTIELIRLMHPSDTPRWDLSLEPQDPAQVVELETNAGESEELALLFRPELAQARLTIANLELDVLQTGNERLPRLDVVGAYGDGRSSNTSTGVIVGGFNDTESYSIGLEFETAIPNRAENARHRRAKLENRRGEGALVQLEENIAAEVRRAIIEVTRQWQRLAATAEAVLSREEAVRVVQGRREVGMATNLDVLQVERDFIESQVDDATARVRYIQALTQLYAAEGTLLERRGISMEAVNEHKETLGTPTYE
jgi:outer membrane protein TolC